MTSTGCSHLQLRFLRPEPRHEVIINDARIFIVDIFYESDVERKLTFLFFVVLVDAVEANL